MQGGVIANTIEVDSLDFMEGLIDADLHGGGIGDLWDGQAVQKAPPQVIVPAQVTRRQARQALYLAGLLGRVQPAIDAIADSTQRAMVQIEWDDSLEFDRNRPTLIALATAMGLGSADLDQLFITAAVL